MSLKTLPVVQVLELPSGPPEYEASRKALLEDFASKVPEELRLSPDLIKNAPRNVTDIPRQCGLLSPEEINITENYDATALAALIREKAHFGGCCDGILQESDYSTSADLLSYGMVHGRGY